MKRLGDFLVEAGAISEPQLRAAIDASKVSGKRLGEVLIDSGILGEYDLAKALSNQLGLSFILPADLRPEASALALVPEALARRHRVLPLRATANTLMVATGDPLNGLAIEELRIITNREILTAVSAESEIVRRIERAYSAVTGPRGAPGRPVSEDEAPMVKLVDRIIRQAVADRASDIHFEPGEETFRVRYRVDGLLTEAVELPKASQETAVSRVKVMAGMDISQRRLPQDGRIQIKDVQIDVDLRVSSLPTIFGEKVVIRILDKTRVVSDLAKLGFRPRDEASYRRMIGRPHGMILVTGPTGSGKTSTLMATLNQINHPSKNIVTIEDPVEYQINGVNQIQVNEKAGLTFSGGLRSILRQDPDVIMIGEIRDLETAQIAVRAALTGHLVLSTLHTNDAAGAITRLIEMGIEPFLVASAVNGVVAQRLVRRVCSCHRMEPVQALSGDSSDLELVSHLALEERPAVLPRACGCPACEQCGYKGRVALFEVLEVSPAVRNLIVAKAPAADIRDQALKEKMELMIRDGVRKVLDGLTTLEEVRRVAFTADE